VAAAQVALGILPAYGGAVRLARLVGRGHAMRMSPAFRCRPRSLPHRLAQWLVPHAKLMDQALEVAAHVASLPPLCRAPHQESIGASRHSNLADASLVDPIASRRWELTEDKAEVTAPGARSASLSPRPLIDAHGMRRRRSRARSPRVRRMARLSS